MMNGKSLFVGDFRARTAPGPNSRFWDTLLHEPLGGGYGVPPPLPKFEDLGHPLELVILERKIGLRWSFSGSDGPGPKFEVLGHPLELVILERKIGLRWSFSVSDGSRPKFEVFRSPTGTYHFRTENRSSLVIFGLRRPMAHIRLWEQSEKLGLP